MYAESCAGGLKPVMEQITRDSVAVLADLSDFVDGQVVRGNRVTKDSAGLEIVLHDPVAQTFDFQRVLFVDGAARLHPLAQRYAWPAELDLMARLPGLELRERWARWDRSPFTEDSTSHVSVCGRA